MTSRARNIQAELQTVCPLPDSCTHLCRGTGPTCPNWSIGPAVKAWPARRWSPDRSLPSSSRARARQEDKMESPTEKQILNRAYEIWERNGRPEGREDEFWHQAEQELRAEEERGDPAKGMPDDI